MNIRNIAFGLVGLAMAAGATFGTVASANSLHDSSGQSHAAVAIPAFMKNARKAKTAELYSAPGVNQLTMDDTAGAEE